MNAGSWRALLLAVAANLTAMLIFREITKRDR